MKLAPVLWISSAAHLVLSSDLMSPAGPVTIATAAEAHNYCSVQGRFTCQQTKILEYLAATDPITLQHGSGIWETSCGSGTLSFSLITFCKLQLEN